MEDKRKKNTREILQIMKPSMPAPKQPGSSEELAPDMLVEELFSETKTEKPSSKKKAAPKKKPSKKKEEDGFKPGQESTSITGKY